jgi:hypothetical protein
VQQWSNWEAALFTRSVRYLRDATLEERLGEVFSVRSLPASEDINTEVEEATALEAVTRRQPLKMQQAEKTWWVL